VILHAPHGAAADALAALKRRSVDRAVFHWHKASAEVTREIVDAGYLISVTPDLVYRARDREMVEAVPIESLLVESDAPWPYQGEFENVTSGPWLVARVAEEVAKIKQLPADEATYQLTVNTCRLFDLVWA
jgi:TatD DNase family protein